MPSSLTLSHSTTAVSGSCDMRPASVSRPMRTPSIEAMATSARNRSTSALKGVPNSAARTVNVTTLTALATLQQAANWA